MKWESIKDKILVLGEDDFVFADMFVSIISQYNGLKTNEDIKESSLKMLRELMTEKLIDVFVLKKEKINNKVVISNILYNYDSLKSINVFLINLDKDWTFYNNRLPQPDELFWISSNEKGKLLI